MKESPQITVLRLLFTENKPMTIREISVKVRIDENNVKSALRELRNRKMADSVVTKFMTENKIPRRVAHWSFIPKSIKKIEYVFKKAELKMQMENENAIPN